MSVIMVQGVFLLTVIVLPGVTCIGCIKGWFGSNCQFKCHCANLALCGSNGECPGTEQCEGSYFGAGCQYVDLANKLASSTTPSYLYDHNDQTCNPDSRATSVHISLQKSMQASFFRITVNDYSKILMFNLAINEYQPCQGEKRHVINLFMVDVLCEQGFMLKDLVISGRIAPAICSVYISGGRNVALKQFANQSSSYWKLSDAKNAVDGFTHANFEWGSCARTNSGLQQNWTLYFDRPVKPLRAVLYNSGTNELHGFILDTFNSRGSLVRRHTDTYRVPQPVYEITLISSEPITKLQILGTTDYPRKSNALHFCEIEVYGDYRCPDNQYGLDCSKRCECKVGDLCSQVTGTCTHNCPSGRYGPTCSLLCSSSCVDHKCEPQSGVCYYCVAGHAGELCASAGAMDIGSALHTPESGSSFYLWSLVPVAIVTVATPVAIYMCLEKKKQSAQTTKPDPGQETEATDQTVVDVERTAELSASPAHEQC